MSPRRFLPLSVLLLALAGSMSLWNESTPPPAEPTPGLIFTGSEDESKPAGLSRSPEAAQGRIAEAASPREPDAAPARVIVRPLPAVSAEETAFLQSLKPRHIPPKEPLRIPEGEDLMLAVKFADHLRGRADGSGRLVLHSEEVAALEALMRIARTYDLHFQPVYSVGEDRIAALTRRAAEKTGEAQADLASMIEVKMPAPTRTRQVALARELHALPEIEWAELEALDMLPPPPAEDLAPPTPSLIEFQTYRTAAVGVNVDYVWNNLGIRGHAGIRITDCEYDLNLDHEDLAGLVTMQAGVVSRNSSFGLGHGTSVLGIMASGHNGYGTSGGAPECNYWFYPETSTLTTGSQSRTACVLAAITDSQEGDIVVLEMQYPGPGPGSADYVPAEYQQSVWTSVKTGSDAGVLTVAAAGNGSQDLDDASLFGSYLARGDSGAIIVGGGESTRVKRASSTYGSRVDMQAWGVGVFTTTSITSGTYVYGGDARQSYTAGFSGTSSATPIVVSAAALLQSTARKICGVQLTPLEIRHLLKTAGQPQTGDTSQPIGPLPNLEAAIQGLFTLHPPQLDSLSSWAHFYLGAAEPDFTRDSDGDGAADLPADAVRKPQISATAAPETGSTVTLQFSQPLTRTEARWVAQRSSSLLEGSWDDVIHGSGGATVVRDGDVIRVTLPQEPAPQRTFLRIKAWLDSPAAD